MHSKVIATKFRVNGIAAEHLDGDTPPDERKAILDRFKSGITKIISNCAILTEGFDCPDAEAVVIARPTSSVTLWLQMIGRVLRPSPGKDYATILDMTDNWFRLGRPCDSSTRAVERTGIYTPIMVGGAKVSHHSKLHYSIFLQYTAIASPKSSNVQNL